jgi:hypothetical protein
VLRTSPDPQASFRGLGGEVWLARAREGFEALQLRETEARSDAAPEVS